MSHEQAENNTPPRAARASEGGASNVSEGRPLGSASQAWDTMDNTQLAAEIAERLRSRLRYRVGRFEMLESGDWRYDLTQGGDAANELRAMSGEVGRAAATGTQKERSKAHRARLRLESAAVMMSVIAKLRKLLSVPK